MCALHTLRYDSEEVTDGSRYNSGVGHFRRSVEALRSISSPADDDKEEEQEQERKRKRRRRRERKRKKRRNRRRENKEEEENDEDDDADNKHTQTAGKKKQLGAGKVDQPFESTGCSQFPAFTWQLTTVCNSSSRRSRYTCRQNINAHKIKRNN